MQKKSSPLDGNKTGDYSSVGLFFPMPIWLAHQFPALPEDRSPAHVTFLIIGKVDPARKQDLLDVVRHHVRRFGAVRCTLRARDEFKNPKGQSIHHLPVAFDRDIGTLRKTLTRELRESGFDVADAFPNYRPHATLEYADADSPYTGPEPTGSWEPVLEVWGMSEVHRVPFGTPKQADVWKSADDGYRAAGTIFMRDGKILLIRRGITAPWMPGSWNLVVGGVEKGESPVQAAKREAFEEVKLKPQEMKALGVARSPGEDVVHMFLSRKFTGEVELDWENDMYEWVGRDTLALYPLPRLQRWFAYKAFEAFDKTASGKISKLASQTRIET